MVTQRKRKVFQRSDRFISLSKSGRGINIVIGGDSPGMGYVLTAPVFDVLKLIAGYVHGVPLSFAPLNTWHGENDDDAQQNE